MMRIGRPILSLARTNLLASTPKCKIHFAVRQLQTRSAALPPSTMLRSVQQQTTPACALRPSSAAVRSIIAPAVPSRALHAGRVVRRADVAPQLGHEYAKANRKNIHVLDAPTLTTWQEIPKGGLYKGRVMSIWYNHAVVPIFAVIGAATLLCSFFMYKYFAFHTEIAWSKEMRGTYDHMGLDDRRAEKHTNRLLYPGMLDRNKRDVNVFPFNFKPMGAIIEKRKVPYPDDDGED